MADAVRPRQWTRWLVAAVAFAGAAAGGWWLGHTWPTPGSPAMTAAVRQALLDHPEILTEAAERLAARDDAGRIAASRSALETPFPGAVLGNAAGKVTLVEFADFACTYCRSSQTDVDALIAANPDLRVVVRQLPIIAPISQPAAKLALAAAAQGKYAAWHHALYSGPRPTEAVLTTTAAAIGLNAAAAMQFAASTPVAEEIQRNLALARQLGISGTPAWVIGDQLLSGAVGRARLQQALDAAHHG